MNYEDFVEDSILFFENAKKRNLERLEDEKRASAIAQLRKEIEAFSKLSSFWDQEKRRMSMMKKYSK